MMFSGAPEHRFDPPDVSSLDSPGRRSNATDEYSSLVSSYGYPTSTLSTELLGLVPVRTADYTPAHLKVALVPNGCVKNYEDAKRILAETRARVKQKASNITPCSSSGSDGWTIVAYSDSDGNTSATLATIRLNSITVKQATPPLLTVEKVAVPAQNAFQKRQKKALSAEPHINAIAQSWAVSSEVNAKTKEENESTPYTPFALLIAAFGTLAAGIVVHTKNVEKRTSRLFYELDPAEQQKYSAIQESLSHLARCHAIWRVEARSSTPDWKRNAGASTLVRRVQITVNTSNPPRVKTNVAAPCINLGTVRLFFLPDILLYLERGIFGGIGYGDFRIEQDFTRFIEEDNVPVDAKIVDRTWRYVNKSGGPDRRFNNNVQLPVVQYGVLVLTSSRGLNIHLNTSNGQESLAFANCWRTLQGHAKKSETRQSSPPPASPIEPSRHEQALKVLGVNPSASEDEISAAYRHLAQLYHPDKVAGLAHEFQELADKRMKEINAAYEAVKRPER